jgi:hypothetical protein
VDAGVLAVEETAEMAVLFDGSGESQKLLNREEV